MEESESIKAAREKNERIRKTSYNSLFMNLDDLRFATNEKVADYRARRLRCSTIIDVGCGIGLQSIAFAKTCRKVYGIEIDKRKAEYAKKNVKLLGLKNVEIIHGDALEAASKINKADIVFCETARSPEAESRSIEELQPGVRELLRAYGGLTDRFCIEVPPQLRKIGLDCEKEYVSVDHKLNRLNLYFGPLKKAEKSAVALPSGQRVEESAKKAITGQPLKYLYEIDAAVVKAGLSKEMSGRDITLCREDLLTSKGKRESNLFRNSFMIIATCNNRHNEIIDILRHENAGKVILRQKIPPEDYWKERKRYEDRLNGDRTIYLFIQYDKALVCKKI